MHLFFPYSHTKGYHARLPERRIFLKFAASGLGQLLLPLPAMASLLDRSSINSILFTPASHESVEKPLLVFRDFVQDFDREVEMRLYQEIAGRQGLIKRLKKRIHFKSRLSLKIDNIKVRLLFVPESRENFAASYRAYCQRAVEFTCQKLNHPKIYENIISLTQALPKISTNTTTVYLVHRLAKAYIATCTFTGDEGESVSYNISGGFVSSQLGAVDLEIGSPQPGVFSLQRKPYSIWQDDTTSRFNLLAVPMEESLHFILGKTTDRYIKTELVRGKIQTVYAVHQIADHWIAIEEAIVGGILHQILKDFTNKYTIPLAAEEFKSSLQHKKQLAQYKYRARGVALVKGLGVKKTIQQYESDPGMLVSFLAKGQA